MTIYLDYQATTPIAPEVAAAMRPWIEEKFANPHSPHSLGREAKAEVEAAREMIERNLAQHRTGRLAFTSGATEALNWAIKSIGGPIVTLATEHAAVLDTVEALARAGAQVTILPVKPDGLVDLEQAHEEIAPGIRLVVAMLVNNEIGVIQPIAELGDIAHEVGALLLCDAAQGYGRVTVPDQCDLVAISAHKIYGPKGIGALFVRDGVVLEPLLHGGGQETLGRSGTLSPALCVGFGRAAREMHDQQQDDGRHIEALWAIARDIMRDWTLNGSAEQRYHGNLNLRREGVDAARLISEVRAVAFSAGSACASGSGRPSHVLAALGLSDRQARSSIRLGFGRYTTEAELTEALTLIDRAANRQLSFAA